MNSFQRKPQTPQAVTFAFDSISSTYLCILWSSSCACHLTAVELDSSRKFCTNLLITSSSTVSLNSWTRLFAAAEHEKNKTKINGSSSQQTKNKSKDHFSLAAADKGLSFRKAIKGIFTTARRGPIINFVIHYFAVHCTL